jgi:hypothetical protein
MVNRQGHHEWICPIAARLDSIKKRRTVGHVSPVPVYREDALQSYRRVLYNSDIKVPAIAPAFTNHSQATIFLAAQLTAYLRCVKNFTILFLSLLSLTIGRLLPTSLEPLQLYCALSTRFVSSFSSPLISYRRCNDASDSSRHFMPRTSS